MIQRREHLEKIKENEEEQKIRIKVKRAARRSGKINKNEGKVEKSRAKKPPKISGNRSSRA